MTQFTPILPGQIPTWRQLQELQIAASDLQTQIDALAIVPAGTISAFAGSTAPTGWLLCDGSAVNRTTYAALFAIIGTTYGAGDGSTTFNLPNLKGRVSVGLDATQVEFDVLGKTGGAKTHTLTVTEMPSHRHAGYGNGTGSSGGRIDDLYGSGDRDGTTRDGGFLANTGGDGAHNNLQPFIVLNYIIKS